MYLRWFAEFLRSHSLLCIDAAWAYPARLITLSNASDQLENKLLPGHTLCLEAVDQWHVNLTGEIAALLGWRGDKLRFQALTTGFKTPYLLYWHHTRRLSRWDGWFSLLPTIWAADSTGLDVFLSEVQCSAQACCCFICILIWPSGCGLLLLLFWKKFIKLSDPDPTFSRFDLY